MQSFSVQTGRITMHGITFGTGDEVVVALHGWLDNCHSFLPMLEGAKLQQTWYCIDLPGHGLSTWRSADAHYYFIDYIDDLYNLLEQLGHQQVHLVGHSMGAMIANMFAGCFPEKVKTVSLIEGVGCVTTPSSEVPEQLRKAILNRQRINKKSPRGYTSLQQIVAARVASGDINQQQATLLMSRNAEQRGDNWYLRTDPKLKNHSGFRFDEAQCIATIKQITAPCQLILGAQGFNFVKQNLELYAKYYKQLNIHTVSGGHHCHMQSRQQTLQYIDAFIAQYNVC
ncbi:alpha/beta fold hydrolase [Pseudoalteromonas mariniglutinosa]|uniref:alpha/beta fold hydrolase n=1 Tax=Pseudoalteromonas mariniglutinosa TaxID=206042 RepID=UPI00384BE6ED